MGICPAQEFERNLVGMLRRRRLVPSRPSAIIRLSPSARSPHEISSGVSRACKHTQARSQQARGCWKEGWPGGCRAYRMRSDAFRPRAGSMQPSGALSKIGERALPHPSGLSRSMILLLCRNVPQTITAFRRSNKPAVRRKRHTTSSRLQQPGHHRQIRLSSVTS